MQNKHLWKDSAEGFCGRLRKDPKKITDFFVGRSSRKDLCGRIPRKDFQCGISICGRNPRKDFAEGFRKDPRKDPRGRTKNRL